MFVKELRASFSQDSEAGVTRLLAGAGLAGPYTLAPLPTGGNNRVYRLEIEGRTLVLKVYFRHPGDSRDRLKTEYEFLSFVRDLGMAAAPRPIARDTDLGLALYSFIAGTKPLDGEPSQEFVSQALDFFTGLNAGKDRARAKSLPAASEACFSLAEHLAVIEGRVERLGGILVKDEVDENAARFQSRTLAPLWQKVRRSLLQKAAARGLTMEVPLPLADRVLSPSDFGFHNAIIREDRRLAFIDFEYAGWDDPAKTIGDFFCQPEVPVPLKHLPYMVDRLSAVINDGRSLKDRVALLLPAYRIKWSCIALNEFLHIGRERRRHADLRSGTAERKKRQLAKAQAFIENLEF